MRKFHQSYYYHYFGLSSFFAVLALLASCASANTPVLNGGGRDPNYVPSPKELTAVARKEEMAKHYMETRQAEDSSQLPSPSAPPAASPSRNAHVLGAEPTVFVTSTPPPGSPPIPTAPSLQVITATSQVHSIQITEDYVAKFALDQSYIYWTGGPDAGLYRFPINGGENELLASSQFNEHSDGYLFSEWLVRTGDWLIFMDTRQNDTGIWALHALNVKTKQDKIVMQENGIGATWSPLPFYSAQGDWLAWSRLELGNPAACDQSILGMTNLATGEQRELDRVCTADHYMWIVPLISENHLIVEQDLPDNQGRKNNIYLWDWTTGERTALTTNGYSNMPAASGKWVVWKEAPRFNESRNDVIYDLTTGLRQSLRVPKGCSSDPRVSGHWLFTQPCGSSFSAYDLEHQQMVNIVQLPKGEKIDAVGLSDQWAVWAVARDKSKTEISTEVQWRRLP